MVTPNTNMVAKAIVKSPMMSDKELLKHVKQTGYP
jgi:hypothetical protein